MAVLKSTPPSTSMIPTTSIGPLRGKRCSRAANAGEDRSRATRRAAVFIEQVALQEALGEAQQPRACVRGTPGEVIETRQRCLEVVAILVGLRGGDPRRSWLLSGVERADLDGVEVRVASAVRRDLYAP